MKKALDISKWQGSFCADKALALGLGCEDYTAPEEPEEPQEPEIPIDEKKLYITNLNKEQLIILEAMTKLFN